MILHDCVFHFEMYLYELFDIVMNTKRSSYIFGVTKLLFVFPGSAYLLTSFQFHTLCTILLFIVIQSTAVLVYASDFTFLNFYMILALLFGNGNSIHI